MWRVQGGSYVSVRQKTPDLFADTIVYSIEEEVSQSHVMPKTPSQDVAEITALFRALSRQEAQAQVCVCDMTQSYV